jgi:uncharacterized membrane protein YphA (DoxX/SURF4 family)
MVGFLTRFFALQLMIFMIIAAFVAHWSLGFFWTARGFERRSAGPSSAS